MYNTLKTRILPYGALLAISMSLVGCRILREESQELAAPLPALPASPKQHGVFLLGETQKRLEQTNFGVTASIWRRLAWVYQKSGDTAGAIRALDKALELINAEIMSPSQETQERSLLADQYFLLGQTERARKALKDFRYQGTSPQAQVALKRTSLTPLEEKRLASPDPLLAPRLVLALCDQGAREAVRKALLPRLEFSLMRGPLGGREEYYHGTLILLFHLGKPKEVLAAIEHQAPPDQLRSLSCLLWGGTVRASTILFVGDVNPAWQAPEPLRPPLRKQLFQALGDLSATPTTDTDVSAGMILAAREGDFALAECFAQKLTEPMYRQESLLALSQRQVPRLSYVPEPSNSFEHRSLMGRNLGCLLGVRDSKYQQRLLEQFLEQMQGAEDGKIFASIVSGAIWKHKRMDLLEKLKTQHPDPAYLVHQQIRQADVALDLGDTQTAKANLEQVADGLARIAKPSHRFQEGLAAQELARRLDSPELLERLRVPLLETLPLVSIMTLKNEGTIQLAGLSYLCHQADSYQQLITKIESHNSGSPNEKLLKGDLMERLAREQARLGETEAALLSVEKIPFRLPQILGLLTVTEQQLKTPPMPNFVVVTSLQAGLNPNARGGLRL
ncbi:tetratricopeptide repeat protein [Armatimonas sp.]|uniref:tetratricopeptide repeat protein n=1 Tax=Armatimonas sp. TaxID=1872638 RepID=UPI00286A724E|nr:tetratricopeptide repeat protein [Armatimonas sp.]